MVADDRIGTMPMMLLLWETRALKEELAVPPLGQCSWGDIIVLANDDGYEISWFTIAGPAGQPQWGRLKISPIANGKGEGVRLDHPAFGSEGVELVPGGLLWTTTPASMGFRISG